MNWNDVYAAHRAEEDYQKQEHIYQPMRQALQNGDRTVVEWCKEGLESDDALRQIFVGHVLDRIAREGAPIMEPLFDPLLRVAVRHLDPDRNCRFVWPCICTFGHERVMETLSDYIRQGSNTEKAAALSAAIWTNWFTPHYLRNGEALSAGTATNESGYDFHPSEYWVAPWGEFRRLALAEFLRNPDLEVRRMALLHLPLDTACYPADLRGSATLAWQIARRFKELRRILEIKTADAKQLAGG